MSKPFNPPHENLTCTAARDMFLSLIDEIHELLALDDATLRGMGLHRETLEGELATLYNDTAEEVR